MVCLCLWKGLSKTSWAGFSIQTEWGGFADWLAKHSHSRKMVQWNIKHADQKISKCSLGFAKASHLRNGRCMIYELLIYRMHVLVCISGKARGSNLRVEPSGGRFQTFRLCDALNSVSLHKSLSVSVWLIVLCIRIVYLFILCVLFICIVCIYTSVHYFMLVNVCWSQWIQWIFVVFCQKVNFCVKL